MNEMVFEIVKLVITLVVTGLVFYLTKVLVPQIKEQMLQTREQVGSEKFDRIVAFADQAVKAAEQIFQESGMGSKKKELAIEAISGLADKIGYDVTEQEINVLIEAAVKAMNDAKAIAQKE